MGERVLPKENYTAQSDYEKLRIKAIQSLAMWVFTFHNY